MGSRRAKSIHAGQHSGLHQPGHPASRSPTSSCSVTMCSAFRVITLVRFYFRNCGYFFLFFFFVVNFVIHWNETAMGLHVFPIPIPPPTSHSTRSPYVFPVHQVRALVSCIQPGLVICFTLDTIHALMLFSWNIPTSPSPTESKRLFYKSVSFFLPVLHIGLSLTSF